MTHPTVLFCSSLVPKALLAALLGISTMLVASAAEPQQPPTDAAEELEGEDLSVQLAKACLRLAEADLADAVERNQRVPRSVTRSDLARLQLQVDFARQSLSYAMQGADFSESFKQHLRLRTRLAESDLRAAQELRRNDPDLVSETQLEKLASLAQVARLRAAMSESPTHQLDPYAHLHWETHRLSEEVLLLNRRIEALEEIVRQ